MGRGFLERLQEPVGKPDERAAVVANMRAVLNSKRGYGSFLPDLGLDTYQGRNSLRRLEEDIAHDVLHYEPRIAGPRVRVLGRDPQHMLNFELKGQVLGKAITLRLRFHIMLGNVEVREVEEP